MFNEALRRDILHRVVVWQRDGMRQGTHSTKTRSEVAGTTKKQAPQKGRGKARIGDGKAPQFVGGKHSEKEVKKKQVDAHRMH